MSTALRRALLILTTASVPAMSLRAQVEPAGRPRFEVTSVKVNTSGESELRFDVQPGGRFVAVNIPLKQLIRAAYTLQLYQIVDAPGWVDDQRFDISATADRDITPTAPWTPGQFAPVQLMIQSLLADRFKMVTHVEMRASQVYSLVREPAPRDATRQLTPATTNTRSMQIGVGTVIGKGVPLPQFAELLSQLTGRVVTDATGLSEAFDIDLRWSPDLQQNSTDAPSIFTAVQEQLGLRLVRSNAPVEHLVIDSIQRPDPD
jgi:bla regulator protein blaR1